MDERMGSGYSRFLEGGVNDTLLHVGNKLPTLQLLALLNLLALGNRDIEMGRG